MNRSMIWSASIMMSVIIIMISAFSLFGLALAQESGSSEGAGEHRSASSEGGREGGSEHGGSGSEGSRSGSSGGDAAERAGANALALDETYDVTRNGARLILSYDAANNQFIGTVENTTNAVLTRVRVEIHLSNGVELGPTTPTDLAAGEILDIVLDAGAQPFDSWTPHAEVGMSEGSGSGEGAGEHGGAGGEGTEGMGSAEGEGESGDPSSPILALDESWDGIVNGVRTAMSYDAARNAFTGFVENPGNTALCYVQIELNLKQGTQTVVELGPQPVGDLAPGAQVPVELLVADEPLAEGVAFDAWEIHPEVFDCAGPGPVNTEGAGEGAGEHGGAGGEGVEGSGANALAPNMIYDVTRNGAQLVMRYNAASNSFTGKVVNMTSATLTRARVEIHLSNGAELGPTTPTDIPPGYLLSLNMPATAQAFDSWAPHVEFGMGEAGGGEGAGEGSRGEGRGEHGGRSRAEGAGEHAGGSEGGGG
ncbi:MAG: hypothetical protein OXI30_14870 [Chloroflexota bacterium]|nr:hypothetical protein [Chloroflexota bacterium]